MRIALFVNDSYFSTLIAESVIREFGGRIGLAVFSTRTTGSWRRMAGVFRKTHARYFVYRSLVHFVSRVNAARGRPTARGLVERQGIPMVFTADVGEAATLDRLAGMDVGVAINFDQLLPPTVLGQFRKGVLNVHASRLPEDKGIAPALWAFARGDTCVWTTIYAMATELDCGDILDAFETPVEAADTAWALYSRICADAGGRLAAVLARLEKGDVPPVGESRADAGSYNGWPDARHRSMLIRSGRTLWRWSDLSAAMMARPTGRVPA